MKKIIILSVLIFCAFNLFAQEENNSLFSKITTPVEKRFALKFSIPDGNYFRINNGQKYVNEFGFLGLSSGLEYYLNDRICLNVDFGGLMNFLLPIPAPFDPDEGNKKSISAIFSDVQVGSNYKRLHYDIGLQFNRTFYYETVTKRDSIHHSRLIDTTTVYFKKNQTSFGLAISLQYRIIKKVNNLYIGLSYYPSFIAYDDKKWNFNYSHVMFLEAIYKLNFIRIKK
jgi:hypothetical protein